MVSKKFSPARHRHYFSGNGFAGVNFFRVFWFSSVLKHSAFLFVLLGMLDCHYVYSTILSPAQVPPVGSKHQCVSVNLHLIIDFLKFRLCLSWGK